MSRSFRDRVGKLDPDDPVPLYMQLKVVLRRAYETKILSSDDALPSERELALDFGISRITVRKALQGLKEEGLLRRRQGSGTFIQSRVEKNFANLSSFSEDMLARGRQPSSSWLRKSTVSVSPIDAYAMGLSPGTSVYRLERLRYADGEPMAIETATLPTFCLPGTDVIQSSLYAALAEHGHRPSRALQKLRAVLFTAEQAKILQVKEGDAGLLIERRGFLNDGRLVEFTQSFYRGDSYDFVAELKGD